MAVRLECARIRGRGASSVLSALSSQSAVCRCLSAVSPLYGPQWPPPNPLGFSQSDDLGVAHHVIYLHKSLAREAQTSLNEQTSCPSLFETSRRDTYLAECMFVARFHVGSGTAPLGDQGQRFAMQALIELIAASESCVVMIVYW